MSNLREFLNKSASSGSLLPDILAKKILWSMQNTKWAETKGGTYSSGSVVAVVSLSYTPLFTGSTIYYAAWMNGQSTWAGYSYQPTAYKNGVDVSTWRPFRGAGSPGNYFINSLGTQMITSFANPAVGTAIALSVNIQMLTIGDPLHPFYNGHTGIVAWEVVG